MIYLDQNAQDYNNDIRAMLQAFFYNEKIVQTQEGTRITLHVAYTADADVETQAARGAYVSYVLEDCEGYRDDRTVVVNYRNRKLARNPLKAALYSMLSAYTGKELPWGSMTGVRPTKIATAYLENGVDPAEIRRVYTDTYLTTSQKADLCIRVAQREQELLRDFTYDREYCIYIGIPFCPSRCLYCSFPSYPIAAYEDRVDAYLDALFREMELIAAEPFYRNRDLRAVYIGGGTPSALTADQLKRLLCKLRECFDLHRLREYCVECGRPDSITKEKLQVLREMGVDRISINPQTMSDATLRLIGRAHTTEQTRQAYCLAREAGFDNINMDMIVGLPGEEIAEVRDTVSRIEEMRPDSLTVHSLAIKRAANLNIEMERYHSLVKGSTNEMLLAVDEAAARLSMEPYYLYRQKNIPGNLENIGYSLRGRECLYNILIMEEKMDILAMGAGASSKYIFHRENRIERVENVKNVDEYIRRIDEMLERKRRMLREVEA